MNTLKLKTAEHSLYKISSNKRSSKILFYIWKYQSAEFIQEKKRNE